MLNLFKYDKDQIYFEINKKKEKGSKNNIQYENRETPFGQEFDSQI